MLRRCWLVLVVLVSYLPPVWAQEGPTVTVGSKEGSPQSEVSVEVSLSGAEAANVRSLNVRIQFPRGSLSFVRVDGPLKMEARLLEETAKSATLELNIAPSDAAQKTLPEGALGQVFFTIATEAEAGTKIPLKTTAKAVLGDAAAAKTITAVDGTVSVVASLIFSCFFYMH